MADPIRVDVSGRGGARESKKPIVIPPERAGLRVLLSAIGAVLTALIGYYLYLPPINFKAKEFYLYIAMVLGAFIVLLFLLSGASKQPEYVPYVRKTARVPLVAIGVLAVFFGIAWAASSPFFQAHNYSEIIDVRQDAEFAEEIPEPDYSSIPKLDETSAKMVANRALGDLAKYVSQFTIAESTTQINYQQKPVRVVTLAYANIIKWFTNTGDGLPGYVIIDMANEKSQFVETEERIRYTDTEHFGRLIKRHLRFEYPTVMFGDSTFEIDENGHPYWIAPVLDKKVGLLGGEDVIGIVLVDAVTGNSVRYSIETIREDKSLQWIDRVFGATLVTTQYNYYGKYKGGFWNSILGQADVTVTTQGYNYIAKDDDVYMYTGITSITGDQSIIGFILVNQRTKDTTFYRVSGATENSAQGAAEGLVSDYKWKATFPLLINVSGQPTYFLSLKEDATGVLQGYSMVNVGQYNKIKVWGKTLADCIDAYVQALRDNGINAAEVEVPDPPANSPDETPYQNIEGVISNIRSAVIDGNTVYYIKLEGAAYYAIRAKDFEGAVLLNKGDRVNIEYEQDENGAFLTANKILAAEDAPSDTQ
ncbi:MAG: CvpA family protein [Oscillospiraceae bacterium]|jgi:hypothetical protein|nr:CvpA family protein [Oscillospiraceae bacterium]